MTMLQHGLVPSTGGYRIERSLRFNSADSAYLNRTPASASNRTTWTWSGWVKRSGLGTTQYIFAGGQTTSVRFESDDTINFYSFSSQYDARINTSQVFRDVGAWYHIVAVFNTGSATTTLTGSSTDRMRLYVNGTQVSNFSATVVPSQNFQGYINNNEPHMINARYNGSYVDTNGNWYMTEVQFIDGSALTAASFGETDTDTGVWKPKAYSGSYGTNGFYLKFADNSGTTSTTLGKDSSGNGNNWTPNNFSVTAGVGNDSLVDTPTPYGTDTGAGGEVRGNYCTMNPLQKGSTVNIANGNLDVSNSTSGGAGKILGTIGVSSGKWYAEVRMSGGGGMPGISEFTANTSQYPGGDAQSWGYNNGGDKYHNGSNAAYGASFTTNDVIGIALDMDGGSVTFYKNGTSQGVAYNTGISGKTITFAGRGDTTTTESWNFGQRAFSYTAPSGFKALCTQNLPTPTIGATSTTQAGKYFNTVLYTGDGNTTKAITVGFQPDFVWIKSRSVGRNHRLTNVISGVSNATLYSDLTFQEGSGPLSSFDSNGFTLNNTDNHNVLNETYVSWNWKANGAGSSNTQGTITSTVSANTTAGFSVVTYTGTGNAGTIGHGLGVAPSMIFVKSRSATGNWPTYHANQSATPQNGNLYLNLTDAFFTLATWNNTSPTSTVFSVNGAGYAVNNVSVTYVAYCFAPIAGYSAFGSYTGNGSTDGPMIFTGFRPAWVLVKPSSTTGDWLLYDNKRNSYNVVNNILYPNASSAEATSGGGATLDFVSNGFKLRGAGAGFNNNGTTFVYACFAEVPTKFALAR